ncbi:hypothetical protein [Streptomyces sp. NRRL S-350]|uniref:hypothetical protein n=1 Tax=Streptomyces sp. NRRL S-350 TaxID=1463902 RepID=UPI0004C09DBC|nr:hypothetical protein [Streptomyces sp. NRRL S-350]
MGLTAEELAAIRADVELAVSGKWTGVPAGGERFAAGMRVADVHAVKLLAEVDLLTTLLAEARERLAAYGTPVLQFPPLPGPDRGEIERARIRTMMEAGFTDYPAFVGLGVCPEGDRCPMGPTQGFHLTKRGRLPVHRPDLYGRRCDGSGERPLVVLAYLPEPAPERMRVHDATAAFPQTKHVLEDDGLTVCRVPATGPISAEHDAKHPLCRACREALTPGTEPAPAADPS